MTKPSPVTRKRVYDTGVAVFSVLLLWGLISADEAAQYAETLDSLLAVALLVLARRNVTDVPDGDGEA